MHLLRIERRLKESGGSQFFQFQEMGHAVGASIPLVLGNGHRSGQASDGLARFAADGTRQSEAGGQILEDAHRGEWLRYDGRRLIDSPLIQCIVIGMLAVKNRHVARYFNISQCRPITCGTHVEGACTVHLFIPFYAKYSLCGIPK
jgi:hypothetical protein